MEENIPERATEPSVVQEKTKKRAPILTITLILIALVGVGFGVYGMFFSNSAAKNDVGLDTKSGEELSDTEDATEIEQGNVSQENVDYTVYYELVDKYLDYDTYSNVKKFITDGFDNVDYMASVAVRVIAKTYCKTEDGHIKYGGLLATIGDLFGEDSIADKNFEEFDIGCSKYKLTSQDSLAPQENNGCDSVRGSQSMKTITSVSEEGDNLIIEVAIAEITYGLDSSTENQSVTLLGKDGDEKYSKQLLAEEAANTYTDEIEQYFDEHLEEFQSYKLIFKKTNDSHTSNYLMVSRPHYYLESGEKLN